jgi:hypothetical protein
MDGIHISVAKGRLPEGLRMAFETIQGTPKELGLFRFDLRVDNACASVTKPLQLLVTGRPILEVFPLTIAMTVAAGKVATESFLVSSSWPELPYSVLQAGAPSLSIRQTAGATPPRGSALIADRVTMRVDASKLPPGIYREKLTMYTWEGANAPTVEVAVTVEAAK